MKEIKGKYNTAVCYCSTLEETAEAQIKAVCDQPAFEGSKIRIMPDVHAGRLMSRSAALNRLSLREYEEEMKGIYSTCVSESTLDESPMAYKSMEEIVSQLGPTAEIVERITPVYNFKAAE